MTVKHICYFVPGRDQDHRIQQGGGQVFLSSGTRQGEHIVLTCIHPTYPEMKIIANITPCRLLSILKNNLLSNYTVLVVSYLSGEVFVNLQS